MELSGQEKADIINELNIAQQQVLYIFNKYPDAIHSDNILFFRYVLPIFYGARGDWSYRFLCEFLIRNGIHFESYKRMARKIREEYREKGLYQRDRARMRELEAAYCDYLSETKY